jgi:imidazolonepropionase-like amidohydrolase
MRSLFLLLLCCCGSTFASLAAETPNTNVTVLKAGRFLDVVSGQVLTNRWIVIRGDLVESIRSTAEVPAGAQTIDLSHAIVLPGLVDCHTHITWQPEEYYADKFRKSPIDYAVLAHVYARRTLEAGFTACRDVGAAEFIDVALKKAIDSGKIPGPRLFVAGLSLGATGGHADDLTGFSPYLRIDGLSGLADGAEEIRRKVRLNIKNGVDWIKMIATAGVLSEEESVGAPQYSLEEMKAMVEESAMWGRKVAAHAHGTEGIKRAIRAGVASVEHGSFLDEEAIQLMKEKGTFLVADIYNDDYILAEYQRLGYPDSVLEKERKVGRTQRESFQKAVKAGVRIAYGTDSGVYPHGWNGKQFAHMVRWGMTPLAAIQSATLHASELLNQKKIGRLEPGSYADLIAVTGNPLDDVTILEKVSFVMKGGAVYKSDPENSPKK